LGTETVERGPRLRIMAGTDQLAGETGKIPPLFSVKQGENREFCRMLHRYNIRAGVVFAVGIAMLATLLPRIIRLDFDRPVMVLLSFTYLSVTFFFYWLIHHYFLLHFQSGLFKHRYPGAALSIVVSVTIIGLLAWGLHIDSRWPVRLYRGLIISTLTWFAVYYYRLVRLLQRSRLENEQLKQENLQAQLATLRQQISPHFLFNSLNTVSSLSREEAVKEYILRLSDVYRYVLHHQQHPVVSVSDELEFIRSYCYILQSRFEEGLKINIRLAPACFNRKILPFALQLLVENAVKHNAISYTDPLAIEIYDEDELLVVANSLRPRRTMEDGQGTGLTSLAKRYRLTAGKDIRVWRDESTFKVQIPFLT
jgi:hypothetical protein